MTESTESKIDVNKVFEAIAKIMSAREHVDIKVVSVRRRDETKEEAG